MAQIIKIKNSTTPGNIPLSLQTGEFAINVTDGSLFFGSATTVYNSFRFGGLVVSGTTNLDNVEIDGDLTVVGDVYTDMIKRESSNSNTTKIKSSANVWEIYAGHSSNEVMKIQAGSVNIAANITGTGNLLVSGATTLRNDLNINGGDVSFADDSKAIFGDGDDLKIYHSGTHSIIQDAGIGHLRIKSSKVMIEGSASGDAFAILEDGAGVELYYDNVKKFETTVSGVTMAGEIEMAANKITGLAEPTEDEDAATKSYVDSQTHTDGTVTSVAISGADGIDIDSGSPITTSGTIALGLSNIPNTSLANSSITITAGSGLSGGGSAALGTETTLNLDYAGTDNFIDSATNLEGTAILSEDTIIYHDSDDDNVKKGFVADLPYSNNAGTVTSVAISGADGIDIDSGSPITSSGTIALGLSSIPNASLANSSVRYGGVSLSLGGTDNTPAFNLSDATAYPGDSSLETTGTITTGLWASNRLFVKNTDECGYLGDYVTFGSLAELVCGNIYYYNGSTWVLADSGEVETSTGLLAIAMGVAPSEGMLLRGMFGQLPDDPGSAGEVLYLSTTGQLTNSAPTAASSVVRVVGYALDNTPGIWWNPDNTWVELS